MELASVRSLKAEIKERVVRPLVAEAVAAGRIGVAARSLGTVTRRQPAIALGVAKGRREGDFRLAIRVQRSALGGAALQKRLDELGDLARGEHDVRSIGRVRKRAGKPWHQSRRRPLLIGASIGHFDITAGTLGAVALHRKSGKPVLLSNNHVLANEDRAKLNDAILQPGPVDGGKAPRDTVGRFLDAVALKPNGANLVDAAIARFAAGIEFDAATLTGLGELAGLRQEALLPGDRVAKVGRTTGLTHGEVTAVEVDDVVVGYEVGDLSFNRQIEIEGADDMPFSAGGDSGSLIVDGDLRAAALLFAGSDQGGRNGQGLTFANEIGLVLRGLGLSLDLPALVS